MKTSTLPISLRPATAEDLEDLYTFIATRLRLSTEDRTLVDLVREFIHLREQDDDLESIKRGIAEANAGKGLSIEETEKSIREELGWPARNV